MGTQINKENIKKKTLPYAGKSLGDQSKPQRAESPKSPDVDNPDFVGGLAMQGGGVEKSGSLFNQQETVEVKTEKETVVTGTGSSETYTQSSSTEREPKTQGPTLDSVKPSQIKSYPKEFKS